MRKIIVFLLFASIFSCVKDNEVKKLQIGTYRGNLIAQDNLTVTLPIDGNDDNVKKIVTYDANIKAPIEKGQVLGKVEAVLNGKSLGTATLVSEIAIEKTVGATILAGLFSFWMKFRIPILIIIAVIVAYMLMAAGLSMKRKKRRRRRKQKYESTEDFVFKSIIK